MKKKRSSLNRQRQARDGRQVAENGRRETSSPSVTDLREAGGKPGSLFDSSWLLEHEEGVFLPVCCFQSETGSLVVLFLEQVALDKPQNASNDAFWAPWRERAMHFLAFAANNGGVAGFMQPCVLWRVREGQLLDSTLATPLAMSRMKDYPGMGRFMPDLIRQLLAAETVAAARLEVVKVAEQEVRHRAARFCVPHRERRTASRHRHG